MGALSTLRKILKSFHTALGVRRTGPLPYAGDEAVYTTTALPDDDRSRGSHQAPPKVDEISLRPLQQSEEEGRATGHLRTPEEVDPISFPPLTRLEEGDQIRIAFVVQHPNSWLNFRSVWEFASQDPRFQAKVILAPFIHAAVAGASCLDEMRNLLLLEKVPFLHYQYVDMESLRPHVVFIQNPYEETRPVEFRQDAIRAAGARAAYIPYGLELGGGVWSIRAQFDTAVHRSAWRIFVRSERSKAMYGKYCLAGNDHVAVTGHPKFDRSIKSTLLPNHIAEKAKGKKIVLWTPHFSVGKPATWSTYMLYSEKIFSEVSRRDDLLLLLRPHPLFFRTMIEKKLWTLEEEASFRQKIEDSSNMALHEASEYDDAFSAADALMTDVGSFLLEFLPTTKPILYLHHPDGLGMNDDESLTRVLYTADRDEDIADFFEMLVRGDDALLEARRDALPEYLHGLNDNVGKNICEHIFTALSADDRYSPFDAVALRQKLQEKSEKYWETSQNTYLAPPDYYDRKETILRDVLEKLPRIEKAIDLGCGDGRFTFVLAEHAASVSAYDISASLVQAASHRAILEQVGNVSFYVSELDEVLPFEKYPLVALMGVTSCIIDDLKFLRTLDRLPHLCGAGGFLITIDTLSTGSEQAAADDTGYVAKYRSVDAYRKFFQDRGFDLAEEIEIKRDTDQSLVNSMFLFRRV